MSCRLNVSGLRYQLSSSFASRMPTTSSLFSPIAGKARVARLQHQRNEFGRIVVDRHHVHLRARDHDVAHRHLRDLQHALDHRQRVGVEELALERAVQQLEELLAVLGLAGEKRGQPLEQRGPVGWRGVGVAVMAAVRGVSRRVRIGDAQRGEDRRLARLHRARGAVGVVIVALQMQHAVDDEVRAVGGECLALRRASCRSTGAHSTMSPASGSPSSYTKVSTLVA